MTTPRLQTILFASLRDEPGSYTEDYCGYISNQSLCSASTDKEVHFANQQAEMTYNDLFAACLEMLQEIAHHPIEHFPGPA